MNAADVWSCRNGFSVAVSTLPIAVFLVLSTALAAGAAAFPAASVEGVSGAPAPRSSAFSFLPMLKELMPEELQEELPLPVGVSVGYFYLTEDLDAEKLEIQIGGEKVPRGDIRFGRLDHATRLYALRADAWVLPFLNVYGMAGYVDGAANHIEVTLRGVKVPSPRVNYSGTAFGVGSVIAAGYGPLFASFDFNYMAVDVDWLDSTVSVLILDPRVGWRTRLFQLPLTLYTGAMYLGLQGTQRGSLELSGVPVDFSLAARSEEPWNALLGAQLELGRHVTLLAEGGLGNRDQAMVSLRLAL